MPVNFAEVEAFAAQLETEINCVFEAIELERKADPDGIDGLLAAAGDAIRHLIAQRNAYKAVLRGMEFKHLDVIGAAAENEAHRIGVVAKTRIEFLTAEGSNEVH